MTGGVNEISAHMPANRVEQNNDVNQASEAHEGSAPAALHHTRSVGSVLKTIGRIFLGIATLGISEGIIYLVKRAKAQPAQPPRVAPEEAMTNPELDRRNSDIGETLLNRKKFMTRYASVVNDAMTLLQQKYQLADLPDWDKLRMDGGVRDDVKFKLEMLDHPATDEDIRNILCEVASTKIENQRLQETFKESYPNLSDRAAGKMVKLFRSAVNGMGIYGDAGGSEEFASKRIMTLMGMGDFRNALDRFNGVRPDFLTRAAAFLTNQENAIGQFKQNLSLTFPEHAALINSTSISDLEEVDNNRLYDYLEGRIDDFGEVIDKEKMDEKAALINRIVTMEKPANSPSVDLSQQILLRAAIAGSPTVDSFMINTVEQLRRELPDLTEAKERLANPLSSEDLQALIGELSGQQTSFLERLCGQQWDQMDEESRNLLLKMSGQLLMNDPEFATLLSNQPNLTQVKSSFSQNLLNGTMNAQTMTVIEEMIRFATPVSKNAAETLTFDVATNKASPYLTALLNQGLDRLRGTYGTDLFPENMRFEEAIGHMSKLKTKLQELSVPVTEEKIAQVFIENFREGVPNRHVRLRLEAEFSETLNTFPDPDLKQRFGLCVSKIVSLCKKEDPQWASDFENAKSLQDLDAVLGREKFLDVKNRLFGFMAQMSQLLADTKREVEGIVGEPTAFPSELKTKICDRINILLTDADNLSVEAFNERVEGIRSKTKSMVAELAAFAETVRKEDRIPESLKQDFVKRIVSSNGVGINNVANDYIGILATIYDEFEKKYPDIVGDILNPKTNLHNKLCEVGMFIRQNVIDKFTALGQKNNDPTIMLDQLSFTTFDSFITAIWRQKFLTPEASEQLRTQSETLRARFASEPFERESDKIDTSDVMNMEAYSRMQSMRLAEDQGLSSGVNLIVSVVPMTE